MSIELRVRVEALEERILEVLAKTEAIHVRLGPLEERNFETSARITAIDVAITQAISDAHRTIDRCLQGLSDRVEALEKRVKKNG